MNQIPPIVVLLQVVKKLTNLASTNMSRNDQQSPNKQFLGFPVFPGEEKLSNFGFNALRIFHAFE